MEVHFLSLSQNLKVLVVFLPSLSGSKIHLLKAVGSNREHLKKLYINFLTSSSRESCAEGGEM